MSKTMMKKGFAWLLLAACLLMLLLPWMKLNENGVTLWDMFSMFVPADGDLEQELQEAVAEASDAAGEQGYVFDAEELSYTVIKIIHGNLRLWEIPRVAAATSDYLSTAVELVSAELEEEETKPVYPSVAEFRAEQIRTMREIVAVMNQLAGRWHTEALLYWIALGLVLAGALCAVVCVLRGRRWGSCVFLAAALALFLLNLIAVIRDNGMVKKLFSIAMDEEIGALMQKVSVKLFHIGAASVCFVIFAALLALHARFDLIELAGRLSLRPREAPEPAAMEPTAEDAAPVASAAAEEPTEPAAARESAGEGEAPKPDAENEP